MATIYSRPGKGGSRWTARVRIEGIEQSKTFSTKAAATGWARVQEGQVETGTYRPPRARTTLLFSDLVDAFLDHRGRIGRAPGKTFANSLDRIKALHGLEPVDKLTSGFWRRHALHRIHKGAGGSTVASELVYVSSVLQHARREGHPVDERAASDARSDLAKDGIRIVSRPRERRISDVEIERLLDACNKVKTSIPLHDIVLFLLATALRRGEALDLTMENITGRVLKIRRKHPLDRRRVEDVPLLKAHPIWPRVDPLDIIRRQGRDRGRVFPYLADTVLWGFERARQLAGVEGVVLHSLRHECLSRLAERGFDVVRLKLVAGHRDLRSTTRYARPRVAAVEGDVTPFVDHVCYLYDDNFSAAGMALDYLAFLVQRGGEKVKWAPVHINEREGTGRGWLFELMALVLGRRNVFFADGDRLTGKFNAWMLTTQLLIVPELYLGTTKAEQRGLWNRIKALITDPAMPVEMKGRDALSLPNRLNVMAATNHRDCVPITKHDRRVWAWESFCPIFVNDEHDLELPLSEIRQQLLPWLVASIVNMLVKQGIAREDIEPMALRLVEHAHPMLLEAYEQRAARIAAEMRAEQEDGGTGSSAILH